MGIRQYRPTSAGRRHGSVSDFTECTEPKVNKPEKKLLVPKKKKGGRNNQGVICVRFRGGGHKQMYRLIDFKRKKDGVAKVVAIEYDPNRTSRIALVEHADGQKNYILAPEGLSAGMTVETGEDVEPRVGNCLPMRKIPLGMEIHCVEMQPGRGGQLGRSAGTHVTLSAREGHWAQITLPSGEVRRVDAKCRATIGTIGNAEHMNIDIGKAGRNRWKGKRPHSRGSAMNPHDHPLGGGEGRSKGGRHPCSPTGVMAKGGKTRHKRKPSNRSIIRRRRPGPHYA
jgi:large subunit ribosomal protein L2